MGSCHAHDGRVYDHPAHVWLYAPAGDQRQCRLPRQPCHGKLLKLDRHNIIYLYICATSQTLPVTYLDIAREGLGRTGIS